MHSQQAAHTHRDAEKPVVSGHTPGPWSFNEGSMTGAVWAEKEFVASVYPNAPEGWDGFSDYDQLKEMRANALLIAAAPELLEALTDLLNHGGARGSYHAMKYGDAIAVAEAVIAKATGSA